MKKLMIIAVVLLASLSAVQVNAQKIGYVNMGEIVTSMPEYAQADTALANYNQDIMKQIQTMRKEFQDNANDYVKDSLKLSDAVKEVRQSELRDQQTRLVQFQQSAQQRVQQKQQDLVKPIIDKAQKAVSAIAKTKGYTYVLSVPGDGSLLVVKPEGDDLTAAVKTKLGLK